MPVALADFGLAIDSVGQRSRLDLAGPRAETHGAAQFLDPAQFAQFVKHAMRGCRIKFAGIRVGQATDVSREFNARGLHAQANAKIWDLLFTRIPNRLQHAFDSAFAEATWHENSVIIAKLLFTRLLSGFQPLGLDPIYVQLKVVR